MTDNKTDNFNIGPLVSEIESVIKNGLNKILKNYVNRCETLENTHKQILTILNDLNTNVEQVQQEEDVPIFSGIKEMTHELVVREEVYNVQNKLDKLEKNYDTITQILDKIFINVKTLNEDINVLKTNHKVNKEENASIKPSIVSACENENIKFEINEDHEVNSDSDNDKVLAEEEDTEAEDTEDEKDNEAEDTEDEKDNEAEDAEAEDNEDEEDNEEEADVEEYENIDVEEEEDDQKPQEVVETEVSEEEKEEVETEASEEEKEEVETEASEEEEKEEVETEASEEEKDEVKTEASEEEEKEEVETEASEEEELFEIEIDDVTYCTNNEENGFIYQLTEDGDVGEKVGYLKEVEPFFYSDEN